MPGNVEPAPRVDVMRASSSSGRWQDKPKYSFAGATGADGTGREQVCVVIGSWACAIMKSVAKSIRDIGVDPLIDPEGLLGAYVLCADKFLPPEFELTPEIVAGVGSSALLVQRAIHAKTIKAHQDKVKAEGETRAALDRIKAQAAERTQAETAPPQAPPVAPPPPAPVVVTEPMQREAPVDNLTERRPVLTDDGARYPVHELG
jgi:hypothetical protein